MTSQEARVQQGIFERPPLLEHKYYDIPSLFTPENLLREARRQKGLAVGHVPAICVLDPDGDLLDHLSTTDRTHRHPTWACYHTVLDQGLWQFPKLPIMIGTTDVANVRKKAQSSQSKRAT